MNVNKARVLCGAGLAGLTLIANAACSAATNESDVPSPQDVQRRYLTRSDYLRIMAQDQVGALAAYDYVDNPQGWNIDDESLEGKVTFEKETLGNQSRAGRVRFVIDQQHAAPATNPDELASYITEISVILSTVDDRKHGTTFVLALDNGSDGWTGRETCTYPDGSAKKPRLLSMDQSPQASDEVVVGDAEMSSIAVDALRNTQAIITGDTPDESFGNC